MNKQFSQITKQITQQKGSVIIICLMLLMGLSLIAVSAMKVSNLNMKIIQNHMLKDEMRYELLQALEQMLSDTTAFNMKSQTITIEDLDVVLNKQCIFSNQSKGYGINFGEQVVPQDRVWEIIAIANDGEVEVGVLQGVEMQMPNDNNC